MWSHGLRYRWEPLYLRIPRHWLHGTAELRHYFRRDRHHPYGSDRRHGAERQDWLYHQNQKDQDRYGGKVNDNQHSGRNALRRQQIIRPVVYNRCFGFRSEDRHIESPAELRRLSISFPHVREGDERPTGSQLTVHLRWPFL